MVILKKEGYHHEVSRPFWSGRRIEGEVEGRSFRVSTDCWLIDRKFLSAEHITFTEGCHYMEDLEFFVKLLFRATNQRITYVPEYLSYYVLRKNSLSYQDLMVLPLSVMNQILDVLKRIYNWIENSAC